VNAISDLGRFGGASSGRLLGDIEQSPAELQELGLQQTDRLIKVGAVGTDHFSVMRGNGGGSSDFLGLGTGQVYAGISKPASGSDVLDDITGTIDSLQSQLDQAVNAASTIDPSNQAALQSAMFKVQVIQNQISELTTAATDILKTLHETVMAIVQNFKAQ
jgi:hypothetical protein